MLILKPTHQYSTNVRNSLPTTPRPIEVDFRGFENSQNQGIFHPTTNIISGSAVNLSQDGSSLEVKVGRGVMKQQFELPKTAIFRDFDTTENIFNDLSSKDQV